MLFGKYGINFYPKHLAKRIRGCLISESRSIRVINHSISKKHIEMFCFGTAGLKQ